MEFKNVLICEHCKHELNKAESLEDLICLPYEWYIQKDLLEKWEIYSCTNCKRIYRKRKLLRYYINKIKEYFKNGDEPEWR